VITLAEMLDALRTVAFDVEAVNAETGDVVTVEEVATYAEVGILSADPGLVIRTSDGGAFAFALVEYGGRR
jgi:hypothetical protein